MVQLMLKVMKVRRSILSQDGKFISEFTEFLHAVPQNKLNEDPNYNIVKVTLNNEVGSLHRILKAFCVSTKFRIKSKLILYVSHSKSLDLLIHCIKYYTSHIHEMYPQYLIDRCRI